MADCILRNDCCHARYCQSPSAERAPEAINQRGMGKLGEEKIAGYFVACTRPKRRRNFKSYGAEEAAEDEKHKQKQKKRHEVDKCSGGAKKCMEEENQEKESISPTKTIYMAQTSSQIHLQVHA